MEKQLRQHASGATLLGLQQAGSAKMADRADVMRVKADQATEARKRPEGLPDSWPDRRVNFENLKQHFSGTSGVRQRKRRVMLEMAGVMEGQAKREERRAKRLERKSRRARRAHAATVAV